MNYTALGLIFDIAGTWCLAYEIIWGYPKRNRSEMARTQLQRLEEHVEDMVFGIEKLPCPPYTPEEKEKMITEMKNKWSPDIRKKRYIVNLEAHRHWSFLWAFSGALLLSIGFTLQIIDALK